MGQDVSSAGLQHLHRRIRGGLIGPTNKELSNVREQLSTMLKKKAIIAAVVGGVGGAFIAYILQIPIVGLLSFPLGGAMAVVCYQRILRQRISLSGGAVIGLLAGVVMSVLVAITTVVVTGVGTMGFGAAVTFFPVLICVLSVLGGWGAAFCLRANVPTDGGG